MFIVTNRDPNLQTRRGELSLLRIHNEADPPHHCDTEDFLKLAADRRIVLAVHGFNNDEEEARAFFGKIAGIDTSALVLGFSWASRGNKAFYLGDRSTARASAESLAVIMREMARRFDGGCTAEVSVVAHSMGCYLMTEAARYFAEETGTTSLNLFSEVVLVAPDLDGEVFEPGRPGRALCDLARRVTVYRSIHDPAMIASRAKRGSVTGRRMGRHGADDSEKIPGNVVLVDASDLIRGHSEYFEHPAVREDIRAALNSIDRGAIPGRRSAGNEFRLIPKAHPGPMGSCCS